MNKVLDSDVVTTQLGDVPADELTTAFGDALAMSRQPRTTLHALYQGWVNTVQALLAAKVRGDFLVQTSAIIAADRASALEEYGRLESRIAELSTAASKETQIARQVDMNLILKRLRTYRDAVRTRL